MPPQSVLSLTGTSDGGSDQCRPCRSGPRDGPRPDGPFGAEMLPKRRPGEKTRPIFLDDKFGMQRAHHVISYIYIYRFASEVMFFSEMDVHCGCGAWRRTKARVE